MIMMKLTDHKALPSYINERKGFIIVFIEDAVIALLFLALALLFLTYTEVPFTLPKLIALRAGSLLLLLVWLYRFKSGELKSIPAHIFHIIIALGVWWVITTFSAIHTFTALNGVHGRYNGLWTYEIYLLLLVIFSSLPLDHDRIVRILRYFVISTIPVALYTAVQIMNLDPIPWNSDRPASTTGNPVITGALLGLSLPFALILFLREKKALKKIWWWLAFFLLFWGMLSTSGRGPFIGASIAVAGVIIAGIRYRFLNIKKDLILIFCALALSFALFSCNNLDSQTARDRLTISGLKTDVAFQSRLTYYKAALSIIKDYPLAGVGFENFRNIYPGYRPPDDLGLLPTMIHNGYLQTALTNGGPSLLLYLALLTCVYTLLIKALIKEKEVELKALAAGFIAAITGHLVQDLSGWPDISLTPFFWIILGLSISMLNTGNLSFSLTRPKKFSVYLLSLCCAALLFVLSLNAIDMLRAEKLFWFSRQLDVGRNWQKTEAIIRQSLEYVPGNHHYADKAGLVYFRRMETAGDPVAYRNGIRLFEEAHSLNPYDPYPLIHGIYIDRIAIVKGLISHPSLFTQKAMITLQELDRNNPLIYEAMARLLEAEGKSAEGGR